MLFRIHKHDSKRIYLIGIDGWDVQYFSEISDMECFKYWETVEYVSIKFLTKHFSDACQNEIPLNPLSRKHKIILLNLSDSFQKLKVQLLFDTHLILQALPGYVGLRTLFYRNVVEPLSTTSSLNLQIIWSISAHDYHVLFMRITFESQVTTMARNANWIASKCRGEYRGESQALYATAAQDA